jgi:hypothetical protein
MKRPALKRLKKPPTPQQLGAGAPRPAASADSSKRGSKKQKKSKKERGRLGRVGGGIGRGAGGIGRLVMFPFRKLGELHGRARIIVWGLLAIIVVIVALQLRGGRDDEKLVREALARFEEASARKDYQTLCDDLFASSYVRQTASSGLPCEVALRTGLEDVKNPTLEVLSVEVNGDRAAARVRGTAAGQVAAEDVYTLVREDDEWKILPPRPEAAKP